MTEQIVAMNSDTFITWNGKSTYNVYRVSSVGFEPLGTFENHPTWNHAQAKENAERWFNDSYALEGKHE